MRKFTNWTFSIIFDEEIGSRYYDIKSSEGIDWYDLMVELDNRTEKFVVGTGKDGQVTWVTSGSVNGIYAPYEHGDVIVTDEYPEHMKLGTVIWDGNKFCEKQEAGASRTKADIERDLKTLLDELKNME